MLRGVRRGGELHENSGALEDVRAGQAGRGRRISRSAAASAGRGRSSWTTAIPVRGASLLREELVRPQRTTKGKGKELPTPCDPQHIAHRGPCGKTRVVPQNSPAEASTWGNGCRDVRVLLSTYGVRGDVEPPVGLAVRLRALGAEVRGCAPPDCGASGRNSISLNGGF